MNDINHINIMGIDPGSNNLGVAILKLDLKTFKIIEIVTIPIDLRVSLNDNTTFKTDLFYRLARLENIIDKIVSKYKPYHIAMETSFINKNRLGAVIPLTQAITTIKLYIYTNYLLVKIFDYSPLEIKKTLEVDLKSKEDEKDKMFNAVKNKKELNKLINIKKLTEHEIDAIAIAYTHIESLKRSKILLCLI